MYVRISPHLPRFQVWPLKSRLFRSQSIDSERKQKNAQNTNIKCEVKNLKTRRNPVSYRKLHFCKRRVWMQVKVRKFPWIEAIRFSEFSSNSWNSTINVVGIGNPGWSRTRSELVCCEAWWPGSNNPDEVQGGYLCWRKYCWFSYFSPIFLIQSFLFFLFSQSWVSYQFPIFLSNDAAWTPWYLDNLDKDAFLHKVLYVLSLLVLQKGCHQNTDVCHS